MQRHRLLILGAIVLASIGASRGLADRAGARLGAALDGTLGSAWRAALEEPEREPAASAVLPAPAPKADITPAPPAPMSTGKASPRKRAASPAPQRGVRVSSATVLALARSGARPAGTLVGASGGCPAGLLLSGVGALGLGVRDGDVLTHAGGRPATSRADVVGMVIAARGARQREISGRFCRGGELFNLIVEQPYLDDRQAEAGTGPQRIAGTGPR